MARAWRVCLAVFLLAAAVARGEDAAPRRPLLVTVDDLPIGGSGHDSPEERARITRDLLAALDKHGIKAVALVTWGNARYEGDPGLLDLWLKAGHELGNHSDRHLSYTATGVEAYIADIEAARSRLAAFLAARGRTLRFFRFPFLREGDTEEKLDAMRAYLERTGQRNLPVTIDHQDWSFEQPWVAARRAGDAKATERVAADYQAALRLAVRHHEAHGDRLFGRQVPQILLLHANEVGAAQWDALFSWLEETGHRFATADQVLADPALREPHRFVATHGVGLWDRIAHGRREEEVRRDVAAALDRQVQAWNRGDLEGFVSLYSEDAAFVSPSGLTRGRQAVLDRYRKRYPDQAAMGTLSLVPVETRLAWGIEGSMLGDALAGDVHGVSVIARWSLTYPDKPAASGLTLLVLHPRGDGWAIVQDASM
jgi:peptidoglycan/xylan/chitin deacetylase (PgdA/CDA1 family)